MPDSPDVSLTNRRRLLGGVALGLFLTLFVYRLTPGPPPAPPAAGVLVLPSDVPAFGTRVTALRVYREVPDQLVLDIDYVYHGEEGPDVFASVITSRDGVSTGHWSFTPARLMVGRHTARVHVGINQDAPASYTSDALLVEYYRPGRSPFFRQTVAFEKAWRRSPPPEGAP